MSVVAHNDRAFHGLLPWPSRAARLRVIRDAEQRRDVALREYEEVVAARNVGLVGDIREIRKANHFGEMLTASFGGAR